MKSADGGYAVKNTSGEVIPGYAVVEASGTADAATGMFSVVKPTATGKRLFFNGPVQIPVGGIGSVRSADPTAVTRVHPDDFPLSDAATLGVVAGSWFLRKSATGFQAIAPPTAGNVTVVPTGGGGSGTTHYARITGNFGTFFGHEEVAIRETLNTPPTPPTYTFVAVAGGLFYLNTSTGNTGFAQGFSPTGAIIQPTTTDANFLKDEIFLLSANPLQPGRWMFGPVGVCE